MRDVAVLRRVAQALERDRHLGREAVLYDLPAAVEQRVPGRVSGRDLVAGEAAAAAAGPPAAPAPAVSPRVDNRVALHAVAVDAEAVGAVLVEERVEVDRDVVVLERLVAVDAVGAHQARIGVVGVHREVEVLAVVGDPDVGGLGRRRPLHRALLHEVGDVEGVPPDGVVEPAVDARALAGPRRTHGRTSGQDAHALGHAEPGREGRAAQGELTVHVGLDRLARTRCANEPSAGGTSGSDRHGFRGAPRREIAVRRRHPARQEEGVAVAVPVAACERLRRGRAVRIRGNAIRVRQRRDQRNRQLLSDTVLQREDLSEIAVRLDAGRDRAGSGVDEARRDAHPIAESLITTGDEPGGAVTTAHLA